MTSAIPLSPQQLARRERRAMLGWSAVVVGLLAVGIGTSIGGALLAVRNKPLIEDSYYHKAMHWDDHNALLQASVALGWKTTLEVGTDTTTAGERAVMLRLTDRTGKAIENADVSLGCFHRANPLALQQAQLTHIEGNLYAASVPMSRAGIWEFRLTVRRAGQGPGALEETYIESIQKELP